MGGEEGVGGEGLPVWIRPGQSCGAAAVAAAAALCYPTDLDGQMFRPLLCDGTWPLK